MNLQLVASAFNPAIPRRDAIGENRKPSLAFMLAFKSAFCLILIGTLCPRIS